jgi:hypothetical protein
VKELWKMSIQFKTLYPIQLLDEKLNTGKDNKNA